MARVSAALTLVAAVAVGLLLVSGGSDADPRTPDGLPGLPPPFLGIAVVGGGGIAAAVDAYGDIVDLRTSPAGPASLTVPAARQVTGAVAPEMAIVPRVRLPDGRMLPFWRADAIAQRYRPGTNLLVTTARFGQLRASVTYGADNATLACLTSVTRSDGEAGGDGGSAHPRAAIVRIDIPGPAAKATAGRLRCNEPMARTMLVAAARSDRRWLAAASPLTAAAPPWAARMYGRSQLVLRAFTDRSTGAVAAGAREGWAYVWPRDAATATLAFAATGRGAESRQTARFLLSLDLAAAARFNGDGSPVAGRAAQGDAPGWVTIAAERAGLSSGVALRTGPRESDPVAPDYQEKSAAEYLGNAIAATALDSPSGRLTAAESISRAFGAAGLNRVAHSPRSGADSAAAWAVRPFALPGLAAQVRVSLRRLLARGGRFGIVPSADWPERDPWSAPTAWSAWAFAALARGARRAGRPALARADRRAALGLLADLRRAATPLGTLPERVDFHSGSPRSTTPLAWPHAFAILALRELWPTD
ncbi:MAG: hypothetical protein ABW065_00615 [Solirubrobacterales bacterium]